MSLLLLLLLLLMVFPLCSLQPASAHPSLSALNAHVVVLRVVGAVECSPTTR
jgi:hypothetical protein